MILLLLAFLVFLLTQGNIKDSISRVFIWTFFVLWVLQGILSQFGFYGAYIPKNQTLVLVSIHLLFFYWGFNVVKNKHVIKGTSVNDSLVFLRAQVEKITNSSIYITILLLSFIYVLTLFGRYLDAIVTAQSITDARIDNQLQELYGNFYYYAKMLILSPLSIITTFLFAFKTFEKRDWTWLVMGLYLLINKSLGGGRIGYLSMFFGVVFVGIYLAFETKKRSSFLKRYSRFLIIGVLAIGLYYLIGLVTAGREGNVSMNEQAFTESQETTNKHFFNYYVTPLKAFDYSINHNFVERQGGFHYGALTFNSIEEALYVILNRIGISYTRPIGEYADLIQDNYFDMGSMNWNALYTWCNLFYCDLGVFGMMIFPFIMGLLVRKVIFYFYKNSNVFSASLLTWVYYIVAMSMINFYFNGFASFVTLVALLYFSKSNRIQQSLLSVKNK